MSHPFLLLLPLLAPLAAPVQDEADQDPWKPVDFVVVQVGDEMITMSDVDHNTRLQVARRKVSVTTLAELNRLRAQTVDDMVLMRLESQAAEDHEESTAETEDRVKQWLERGRRDQSAVEYTEELQESGFTPHSYQEQQLSQYRTSAFRNQGLYGPRPTRDAYVRPGEQRELYRIQGRELGGDPSYRFQDLVVTADQAGGVEEARALMEQLRQRLVDGEDFSALHEEYGTTEIDTRGVTRLFGPDTPMPDPAIRRFALESEVGAVSPVYQVTDPRHPGEVVGYRVLRLYEFTPGSPPPPFAEAGTQELIRKIAAKNRNDIWLSVSRAGLSERSYLWLNDQGAPPRPAEAGAGAASAVGPR